MEKSEVKAQPTPRESLDQIIEKYSALLERYRSLMASRESEPDFLACLDESIEEVRQDVSIFSASIDDQNLHNNQDCLSSLDLLVDSRLKLEDPESEPFYEDFIFAFPGTLRQAFLTQTSNPA